jgi:hypothetical protein
VRVRHDRKAKKKQTKTDITFSYPFAFVLCFPPPNFDAMKLDFLGAALHGPADVGDELRAGFAGKDARVPLPADGLAEELLGPEVGLVKVALVGEQFVVEGEAHGLELRGLVRVALRKLGRDKRAVKLAALDLAAAALQRQEPVRDELLAHTAEAARGEPVALLARARAERRDLDTALAAPDVRARDAKRVLVKVRVQPLHPRPQRAGVGHNVVPHVLARRQVLLRDALHRVLQRALRVAGAGAGGCKNNKKRKEEKKKC